MVVKQSGAKVEQLAENFCPNSIAACAHVCVRALNLDSGVKNTGGTLCQQSLTIICSYTHRHLSHGACRSQLKSP